MTSPRALAGAVLLLMAACGAAAQPTTAPGGSTGPTIAGTTSSSSTTAESTTAVSTTAPVAPTTTTTLDPGALPQTKDKPTASDPTFQAGARLLWQAITTNDPDVALSFFFPAAAYRQVKAIPNPDRDYTYRLIANFRVDVRDDHAQLGAGAGRAALASVTVPDAAAVWVGLGQEQNRLSYWRVSGTLLRYRLDGRDGVLPVTSLISWRGRWYVVHLGRVR